MNSRTFAPLLGCLLLATAPGCGANSPAPGGQASPPPTTSTTSTASPAALPSPGGTATGPTGVPQTASPLAPLPGAGRNPEARSVAVLTLIADPANPLGLDAKEKRELGEAIFQAGLYRDQTRFRQSVLHPLLGDLWSSQLPAMNWEPDITPEAEFLKTAEEALKELDARAAGQKATASPLPEELKSAASLDEPVDTEESDYEKAVPPQDRLTLMNLGYLIRDVAPDLEPATAAKVAAETRELVVCAEQMQKQWTIIQKIATKGDRAAKVTAEESKIGIPDLSDANQKAQMWADDARED